MADRKFLFINTDGLREEHSIAADSVQMLSFKTANYEMTDAKLGNLIGGVDANDEHIHDARYFTEVEHINTSVGIGDAGKPIVLDATGQIADNMIDVANIDHGALAGLGDDDHTIYTKADGTRAFTGPQSMGGFKLTNMAAGTVGTDAVNLTQLQSVEAGFQLKESCRLATTAALPANTAAGSGVGKTLTMNAVGILSVDSVATVLGDRLLIKDEAAADIDNGLYEVTTEGTAGVAAVLTRTVDADGTPAGEVANGLLVFIQAGTTNNNTGWSLITADPITVDTTALQFSQFQGLPQYTASNGVELVGVNFQSDLLASGGLKIVGTELAVEPTDFAGSGLIDNADNLDIDWSTTFAEANKAIQAVHLASNANGEGASIIGIEDAGALLLATDVEGALQELAGNISAQGIEYTVGVGGVTKGDLCYLSATNTILPYSVLTATHRGIGIALTTEIAAATVKVLANDTKVTGLTIAGAPAVGDPIYWDGTQLTATLPSVTGSHVWQAGVLSATGEMHVEARFVKKNA
jgi:hypothetical protein